MGLFDKFRKQAQNTTINTQTDIVDLDSGSYEKFTKSIDDFQETMSEVRKL